jgi:Tol biopolymer transport system component
VNKKEYERKLKKWEAQGYDVSELREKWFPPKRLIRQHAMIMASSIIILIVISIVVLQFWYGFPFHTKEDAFTPITMNTIYLSDMNIYPLEAIPNEIVTISIYLNNNTSADHYFQLDLEINQKRESGYRTIVLSNERKRMEFYIVKTEPGLYKAKIGSLTGSFTVVSAEGQATNSSTSPTGLIAFASDRDNNGEIYAMRPDGSALQNLTNEPSQNYYATWWTDGKICFSSGGSQNEGIYIMDRDGLNKMKIRDYVGKPKLSPDGKKILFTELVGDQGDIFATDIFTMDIDGSNRVNLTGTINGDTGDSSPCWSPDGNKIVFETARDGNLQLFTMDSDGSNQKAFDPPVYGGNPSWSPDGRKIAFSSSMYGGFDIWVMNADGSRRFNLTNYRGAIDDFPCWSPDSSKIVFSSDRDGNMEIYIMDIDGFNQINLTHNPSSDTFPCWLPEY